MSTVTTGWNFADVFEALADRFPDAPAQIQGDRRYTWAEFDRRADGVAAALIAHGVRRHDKVAQYLYNCPEYLESMYGMFKVGAVPINTNYRYGVDEIAYLWDNADVVAVVFHGTFTERIAELRDRLPRIRTWLWVDDDAATGSGPCRMSSGARPPPRLRTLAEVDAAVARDEALLARYRLQLEELEAKGKVTVHARELVRIVERRLTLLRLRRRSRILARLNQHQRAALEQLLGLLSQAAREHGIHSGVYPIPQIVARPDQTEKRLRVRRGKFRIPATAPLRIASRQASSNSFSRNGSPTCTVGRFASASSSNSAEAMVAP